MNGLIVFCVLAVFGYALLKVKKIPFIKNPKRIGIQEKPKKQEIITRTYKFEMADFTNPLEFDKLIYDCTKADSDGLINDNAIIKDFKYFVLNENSINWLYLTIVFSLTD